VNIGTVTQLAGGSGHALALRTDGSVIGWGSNSNGETAIPADLSNVVQVDAGGGFSAALIEGGTVRAWGYRWDPSGIDSPPDLQDVKQISCGSGHTLALLNSGHVQGWGNPFECALRVPGALAGVRPGILRVEAGTFFSLAIAEWECPADLDQNLHVDSSDLSIALLNFGLNDEQVTGDVDGNIEVDAGDIALIILSFGTCVD
jgi:alpha-tubulin suppressor-like RCC1 family protein